MNRAPIDKWTLVHAASGAVAGLLEVPALAAVGSAVAYEFLEQYMERNEVGHKIFHTSGPESVANATVDVLIFALTYYLTKGI